MTVAAAAPIASPSTIEGLAEQLVGTDAVLHWRLVPTDRIFEPIRDALHTVADA